MLSHEFIIIFDIHRIVNFFLLLLLAINFFFFFNLVMPLMILELKKKEIIKFFNTSIDFFFVDRWVILSNTLASSIVNLFSLGKIR